VELASQFMENWCYHKETLLGMAKHYKTGETLPVETYEKMYAARSYRAGMMMLRQLSFGMTDMALHTADKPDIKAIEKAVAERTALIPPLPEDRFLCSFSHIFAGGYAAGYYSYKWAEVLSADAFSAFEEAGLEDPEALSRTGASFRDTVLALGGSRHPAEVFKAFRGREPSPKALLRHSGLVSA
jgi:oligopeptidase A